MNRQTPDYIIDPDGEVIIVLRDADSPFAQALEDTLTGMTPPAPGHYTQSPAEVIEPPQTNSENQRTSPELAPIEDPAAEEQIDEPLVKNCFYIQVSAKHLMFSSPMFKSMLTGGWKESVNFLQKSSVEITAEGWGIEEFLIVLRALHGKYYHIPRKLTLEMLAKVAVIADYYECKEALYVMTDVWTNNLEEKFPTRYSRNSMLWVWVSWFFQLPSPFKETTSTVMSCSENSINSWGLPIPDKVIGLMNQSREEAINNVLSILHETREALLGGSRGCRFECRAIMYGALTIQMQSSDLLSQKSAAPFPNLNYKYLRRKVLSFKSPTWPDLCSRYGGYDHTCLDSSFGSLFANLKECIEGLDLNSLDFS
ncbi:unnamed protein product [Penicillium egyptiacum]|uniref:BTB domain-containing protein n=1 Tax=Penicillium egyptiacum TaxID=1303716 RepID=A0A9W4PAA8_9EURO|nr:unnamed protein product [Penicillium egyptiacum]